MESSSPVLPGRVSVFHQSVHSSTGPRAIAAKPADWTQGYNEHFVMGRKILTDAIWTIPHGESPPESVPAIPIKLLAASRAKASSEALQETTRP